jgi:hypothetical protein
MNPGALAISILTATILSLGWILIVTHIINTASVPGDIAHWTRRARHEAYDLCYNGCDDCFDTNIIESACHLTTRPELDGIECDARSIWPWADRYPEECLVALGQIMRGDELKSKRFKLWFLYLLTVVTAGLGWIIYEPAGILVHWVATWKRQIQADRRRRRRRQIAEEAATRLGGSTTPLLRTITLTTLLIALLVDPATAYRCTGYQPVHNQPFVSTTDPTLFGNIHGWLADCYQEPYECLRNCHVDNQGKTNCEKETCSREVPNTAPRDYVRAAAKRVKGCGFEMVDVVPGIASRRIANPSIERDMWVKVSVNRFNGTEGVEKNVKCLADMVGWPKYQPSWWSTFEGTFVDLVQPPDPEI